VPGATMARWRAFPLSCSSIFRTILKWLQLALLLLVTLLLLRSTVRSSHTKGLSTSVLITFKKLVTIIIIIIIIIMSWGGDGGGGKQGI